MSGFEAMNIAVTMTNQHKNELLTHDGARKIKNLVNGIENTWVESRHDVGARHEIFEHVDAVVQKTLFHKSYIGL